MNEQLQLILVIFIVMVAVAYTFLKAKKRFTANNASCGGCDKCGH